MYIFQRCDNNNGASKMGGVFFCWSMLCANAKKNKQQRDARRVTSDLERLFATANTNVPTNCTHTYNMEQEEEEEVVNRYNNNTNALARVLCLCCARCYYTITRNALNNIKLSADHHRIIA